MEKNKRKQSTRTVTYILQGELNGGKASSTVQESQQEVAEAQVARNRANQQVQHQSRSDDSAKVAGAGSQLSIAKVGEQGNDQGSQEDHGTAGGQEPVGEEESDQNTFSDGSGEKSEVIVGLTGGSNDVLVGEVRHQEVSGQDDGAVVQDEVEDGGQDDTGEDGHEAEDELEDGGVAKSFQDLDGRSADGTFLKKKTLVSTVTL